MANILKWLFLTLATGVISTLVFLLLGKSAKLNELQRALEDAKIDLEYEKIKKEYVKSRSAYEKAIQNYRDILLKSGNVIIIPAQQPSDSASATITSSSSATPTQLH